MNNIDQNIFSMIQSMNEEEIRDTLFEVFSYVGHKGIGGSSEVDQFNKIKSIYMRKIISPQKRKIEGEL